MQQSLNGVARIGDTRDDDDGVEMKDFRNL